MGDAATSALVKVIFEKLTDELLKEYARAQGIHSELENLGKELSLIQALLHDASDKIVTERSVRLWLNSLQHLAYDIEDVLDDVATEAMRLELTQEAGASTSKVVRKLIVPTCCTNFSLSHRLSPKIDSITKQLKQLYEAKDNLGLTVKEETHIDPNRGNETSLLESDVVGREAEKEKFLNKLLGGESSEEKFSIIPIVGMGGVGKTTLARLLYNDTQVEAHFDLKAWVCVSDDFNILKISKTIFCSVIKENTNIEDLDLLQKALIEQVKDKRFLLVLDDVWTDNYDHWEKLVRPLYSGACGSRVIITTRKKDLLEKLGFDHLDLLQSLSSKDALSLFAFHALGVDNFDSYPNLREKGESIVKKCGTLPLALKAVGRLLRNKTPEKWDDVLKSKVFRTGPDVEPDPRPVHRFDRPDRFDRSNEPAQKQKKIKKKIIKIPKTGPTSRFSGPTSRFSGSTGRFTGSQPVRCTTGPTTRTGPVRVPEAGPTGPTGRSGPVFKTLLKSEVWDSKYVGDLSADWKEIFPVLMLSYHDLSSNLKRVFAYCSLFPKDFLFNKEELVLLWMAEGFLNQSNATKSQEDVGQEYFEALLSRTFFQRAPNVESLYVMHDLMNDLATFVAEVFYLRSENHAELGNEALTRYRHLSFVHEKYEGYQKFEPFKRASSLRTLMAVSVDQNQNWFYFSSKILVDLLPQLPLLRVLSLTGSRISEVPDFIGSLKHLRYLNLSQSRIKKLPDNIGNLFNLQTLIIYGCSSLTKLPKSFSKLKKLRHFDIRDTWSLNKLPLGIGELKSLQIFSNMVVGGDDGFAITELKGLNNLYGELSIKGLCKVQSTMDIHETKLSLKRLTKLELNWGDGPQHGTLEKEVLKELKPDSEWLKELSIDSYPGIEFPKWVGHPSFDKLVDVSIKGCVNCKSLPPLGQLPSLKELFINDMPNVKFIGSELTGTNQFTVSAFPSLEILKFRNMKGWEVWSTNNEVFDAVFPCLRELNIQECPQLIEVSLKPLLSVEILRLRDMRRWKGWSINNEVSVLPYLREFHIDNCPELIKFPPETTSNEVFDAVFPCLRELNIQECPQLIEVSLKPLLSVEILRLRDMRGWKGWSINNEVSVLPSLRELYIDNCPELIKFPPETTNSEVSVLSSLRELHIRSCPELIEFSLEKLPELEILRFKNMLGWRIWSTKDAVFPCLRELYIDRCPQLVEVLAKALPLLRVLKIYECGGGVLRSLVQAAPSITMLDIRDISGLTYEVWSGVMEHIGAVEEVLIQECKEIRYLWESEEEASKVLVNIKKLKVMSCSNLVSLGEKEEEEEDNFGSSLLSSLRTLYVYGCDKMERCCCPNSIESLRIELCRSLTHVSFPTSATGEGGGQKLKSLDIVSCSELVEKINNISMGVLESIYIREWTNLKSMMQLGNFIYVTKLYLYRCPSLESFSDIPMSVLTHLRIEMCEKMESFSAHQMSNLTSLKRWMIRDCPSIDVSCHGGVWPPNLCSLEIGRLKKPMSKWGPQSFPSSLVHLELCDEADVKNFRQLSHLFLPSSLTKLTIYNFEKLESLSMGLQHLTSLQHLTIWGCPNMKHLPKQLLPSLLSLEINDCPKLRKRCERRGSHYYPLISHIPDINIRK